MNSITGTSNWVNATTGLYAGGTISGTVTISDGTGIVYGYKTTEETKNGQTKRIGPKLYFNYVKSKLNKSQNAKLKARLTKLQKLTKDADDMGQKGLYEELSKMLMMAVKESESVACGYDVYVNRKDIDKFKNIVTEDDKSYKNPVKFSKLEDFPRAVPANIQKIIKSVKAKGIFDELWILYLDYTDEVIKSNKQKIREKDPILFGKFSYDNEKHYYIADWIDEYCDLTLSKFVDKLKANDQEYKVSEVQDISKEYLEQLKQEIKDREDRLKNTKPSNYKQLMEEEDKSGRPAPLPPSSPGTSRTPWWKFWS